MTMKFLCFAYDDEELFGKLGQEEWLELRQEVLEYVDSLRERGILLATHPLQTVKRAATVRVRDGRPQVVDGPFAEAKEHVGGYFLIEVEDRDEALRVAAGWPSARIGAIEVRPVDEGLRTDRRYDL